MVEINRDKTRIRFPDLKKAVFLLIALLAVFYVSGCEKKPVVYKIEVEGSVKAPGMVSFLGMDINVYDDQASNPCGECTMQPAHIFVGDTEKEVVAAMVETAERINDLWKVKEVNGNAIIFEEYDAGSVKEVDKPLGPEGITFKTEVIEGRIKEVEVTASATDIGEGNIGELENTSKKYMNPDKIAAVYGMSYEAMVVLGVEDKVVVRADVQTADFPWAEKVFKRIKDVPYLNNVHSAVNFEELMKYDPELVYAFPRVNELTQLNKAGVSYISGKSLKTLDDGKIQLLKFAEALNEDAVKRAEEYGEYFDSKLEMITSVTKNLTPDKRPAVYYSGVDTLTTYGKFSDIPAVIMAAGGNPVTKDLPAGSRTQIDKEQLIAWNPEYIFIDHGGMNDGKTVEEIKKDFYEDKNYSNIIAIKNDNVFLSPSGVFYWDMGLQKILLIENMAKILHPEEFENLDMAAEVVEFYNKFYDYPLTAKEARMILNREF